VLAVGGAIVKDRSKDAIPRGRFDLAGRAVAGAAGDRTSLADDRARRGERRSRARRSAKRL